jgi:site-specific DNA-methyltransferase (cytosine-N4-specific)
MLELNKIYLGNALQVLKTFPDNTIDCIVTSPPYWALRDYSDKANSIFGGDEDCSHNWMSKILKLHGGTTSDDYGMSKGINTDWTNKSDVCSKCGAWRGQLGLEDNFNDYIQHLCDIFEEAKRVLRKDGTLWVNIGDTYYSPSTQGSNDGRQGFKKNPNSNFTHSVGNGKCLICGKPTLKQFCSKECLNKKGNNFRSQKRLLSAKSLCNIPARFAIEMQNRGWILRNTIIWHKPSCMPCSVKDRFTVDFEYVFFFVKSQKYYFKQQIEDYAISSLKDNRYNRILQNNCKRETEGTLAQNPVQVRNNIFERGLKNGRNKRCVWSINPARCNDNHFATYPKKLIEPMIDAGCPINGVVLDPFFGTGTTGIVAMEQNKNYIGIDINIDYINIANNKLEKWKGQKRIV